VNSFFLHELVAPADGLPNKRTRAAAAAFICAAVEHDLRDPTLTFHSRVIVVQPN